MRQHIQGLILLIVMLLVLWATTSMAGPVISDALSGDDPALHAEAAEVVPPGEEELAVPLNGDEILELQAALTQLGYDPGPIDGLMGSSTEAAAAQALIDRDLPATTDNRSLFELLQAELGTGPSVEPGTGPSAEPGTDAATPAPDLNATDEEFVNEPEPGGTPEG